MCRRVAGADLGAARWAFGGVWAPCSLPAVCGREDTPCSGATKDLLLFRTFVRKGASKFGNWERMKSDWTEAQESDPGLLKGPPQGFRWPGSTGGLGSRAPPPPSPSGKGPGPAALQLLLDPWLRDCLSPVPTAFLGFVVSTQVPVLFQLRVLLNTCSASTLVCASQIAQGFAYCPI